MGTNVRTSAVVVSFMEAMRSFVAILAAAIADAYISRYFVVLASTALFIQGLLVFSVTYIEEYPKSHIYDTWVQVLLCIALALIAAGKGGQEQTLRKFGADQFAEHIQDKEKEIYHSVAWWYVGAFLGAAAGLGLGVAANKARYTSGYHFYRKILLLSGPVTMGVAFFVAVLGTLCYYRAPPGGSPLVSMLRVLVASARNVRLDYPADENKIHGRLNPNGSSSSSMAVVWAKHNNSTISNVADAARTATAAMGREFGSVRLRNASLKENQRVLQPTESTILDQEHPQLVIDEGQGDDDHIEESALLSSYDGKASPPPPDVSSSTKEAPTCLLQTSQHPSPPVFELESAKSGVDKESLWLPHTNRLRCLDKAAVIYKPEAASQESKWRLCTQTEVEETKYMLRLLPIWSSFLMYGMVLSLGKTFFIYQEESLNRGINSGSFQIPMTFLLAVGGLSKAVLTKACLPLLNRFKMRIGVCPRIKLAVGFLFSASCCLTAYLVETRRFHIANKTGYSYESNVSILWLVPQFCLLGAMDGLVEEGMADLFVDQVQIKQLWKCKAAFCDSVKGMGSMLGAVMILVTMTIKPDWLGGHIMDRRLDHYYFTLFVMSLINLFVYGLVARRYPCKAHTQNPSESGKGSFKRPVACLEAINELLFWK
ncbi:hypothetical protein ACLOJK_012428 [Asimina triloba]